MSILLTLSHGVILGGDGSVLAYRDDSRRVDARRELARLRRLAGNSCGINAALSLLIRAGTIEAGLVDAHQAECDGFDGTTAAARARREPAAYGESPPRRDRAAHARAATGGRRADAVW